MKGTDAPLVRPGRPFVTEGFAWRKDRSGLLPVRGVVRHGEGTPFLRSDDGLIFHENHMFADRPKAMQELWRFLHDKKGRAESDVARFTRLLEHVEQEALDAGIRHPSHGESP